MWVCGCVEDGDALPMKLGDIIESGWGNCCGCVRHLEEQWYTNFTLIPSIEIKLKMWT